MIPLPLGRSSSESEGLDVCQVCVKEGRFTQDELDARILAGDNTVMPMTDLSPDLFIQSLVRLEAEAIAEGMDPAEAVQISESIVAEYVTRRAQADA